MRTMLIAAVTVLGVGAAVLGPAAVAAPAVSPFVGEYTGPMPDWPAETIWGSIAVASSGKIVGTQPPTYVSDGRVTGSVKADGTFEILATWNPNKFRWFVTDVLPAGVAATLGAGTITYVASSGTIVRGGDGNLYGTTTRGNSFVWTRK